MQLGGNLTQFQSTMFTLSIFQGNQDGASYLSKNLEDAPDYPPLFNSPMLGTQIY